MSKSCGPEKSISEGEGGALRRSHFGALEVERLTGVNRITLHSWDRVGLLRPSVGKGGRGTGNRRRYSFSDLVALRVIRRLRSEGISVKALKKVAGYLKEKECVESPFAERMLAVSGRDVVMVSPEEIVSVLKKPGQHYLLLKLDISGEAERLRAELGRRAA